MPIYEYRCNGCGKEFEAIQKFSDKPLNKCPHCSGKKVERLISSSSFVLKGSGWYKTDYAGKEKKEKQEKQDKTETPPKPACAGCPSNRGD